MSMRSELIILVLFLVVQFHLYNFNYRLFYDMNPVVSYNSVNTAVYTTISTEKNKLIPTYQHSFIAHADTLVSICFCLSILLLRRRLC
jgi:hypothetical protein